MHGLLQAWAVIWICAWVPSRKPIMHHPSHWVRLCQPSSPLSQLVVRIANPFGGGASPQRLNSQWLFRRLFRIPALRLFRHTVRTRLHNFVLDCIKRLVVGKANTTLKCQPKVTHNCGSLFCRSLGPRRGSFAVGHFCGSPNASWCGSHSWAHLGVCVVSKNKKTAFDLKPGTP